MSVSIESRIHRILRELPQFSVCQSLDDVNLFEESMLPFDPDEKLCGFYENAVGSIDNILILTDQRLYWYSSGNWTRLRYSDILSTEWPKEEKMNANWLSLKTDAGRLQIPTYPLGESHLI